MLMCLIGGIRARWVVLSSAAAWKPSGWNLGAAWKPSGWNLKHVLFSPAALALMARRQDLHCFTGAATNSMPMQTGDTAQRTLHCSSVASPVKLEYASETSNGLAPRHCRP
jgi:hypothetical protein